MINSVIYSTQTQDHDIDLVVWIKKLLVCVRKSFPNVYEASINVRNVHNSFFLRIILISSSQEILSSRN